MGETSREANHTYFKGKQEELEVALSTAVRAAVSSLHPDPILFVSQHLAAAAAKAAGSGADIPPGGTAPPGAPTAPALAVTASHVAEIINTLRFTPSHQDQQSPPRPSVVELAVGQTSSGPVTHEGGVVIQGGPSGSLWLRVGCDDCPTGQAPALTAPVMDTLRGYVEHAIEMLQRGGGTGSGVTSIHCAVALRASTVSLSLRPNRDRQCARQCPERPMPLCLRPSPSAQAKAPDAPVLAPQPNRPSQSARCSCACAPARPPQPRRPMPACQLPSWSVRPQHDRQRQSAQCPRAIAQPNPGFRPALCAKC
jgi:hypothetical protein